MVVSCFGAWPHAPCYVCEVLAQGSAAGALDIEGIQLHAFVNLVFEPWASVCSQLQGLNVPEADDIYAELSFAVLGGCPLSKRVCQCLARCLDAKALH